MHFVAKVIEITDDPVDTFTSYGIYVKLILLRFNENYLLTKYLILYY